MKRRHAGKSPSKTKVTGNKYSIKPVSNRVRIKAVIRDSGYISIPSYCDKNVIITSVLWSLWGSGGVLGYPRGAYLWPNMYGRVFVFKTKLIRSQLIIHTVFAARHIDIVSLSTSTNCRRGSRSNALSLILSTNTPISCI